MLYAIYKSFDHLDDRLLPSQRQFFPQNPKERTREKFLAAVPVIYEILRDARDKFLREETFGKFWTECNVYLAKCGYSDTAFMLEGALFHRQSFNFWRREFKDSLEGLDTMFSWFKSCFGIQGNDEYCIVNLMTEVNYDWRKMAACHAGLHTPPPQGNYIGGTYQPQSGDSLDWRPETVQMLHGAIERMRYVEPIDTEAAERALSEMRIRNQERGIA